MGPGFDILTLLASAALLRAHGSPFTHVWLAGALSCRCPNV